MFNQTVTGEVVAGYQIASGGAEDSPYPSGSIPLQKPFFKKLGLDLDHCFDGTLNVDIAPNTFEILQPSFRFELVEWMPGFAPETFSFIECEIVTNSLTTNGFVYYPHPETKTQHFHNNQRLEVLAPLIPNLNYGDAVMLRYDTAYLNIR